MAWVATHLWLLPLLGERPTVEQALDGVLMSVATQGHEYAPPTHPFHTQYPDPPPQICVIIPQAFAAFNSILALSLDVTRAAPVLAGSDVPCNPGSGLNVPLAISHLPKGIARR